MKQKIFQRGYKKEKSVRGMGIGLSLIDMIMQNYNGEILVKDRIPDDYTKGSVFILKIPKFSE